MPVTHGSEPRAEVQSTDRGRVRDAIGASPAGLEARYPTVISVTKRILGDLREDPVTFAQPLARLRGGPHAIDHWVRAGLLGLAVAHMARSGGGLDVSPPNDADRLEEAILLASFFHDAGRTTDGPEPLHGRAGERLWSAYADRRAGIDALRPLVSEAILLHVGRPVQAGAGPVAVCLCNGDRLDRVRLGQTPTPKLMYEDGGAWRRIFPHTEALLRSVTLDRVLSDLGEV